MLILIHVGIIALLLVLGGQDLLYRAASWFIFPLLSALAILKYQLIFGELGPLFRQVFLNGVFLFIQFFLLYLYFCIKNRKWINLTENYLGWGDILFFITSVFFFSSLNFLFFYLLSLILMIVIALPAGWTKRGGRTVPLAGGQALILTVIYGIDLCYLKFDMLRDGYLLTLLTGADKYL